MVQLTVKGVDKLNAQLKAKADRLIDKVKLGMLRGMEQFGGKFIREFLSSPRINSKRLSTFKKRYGTGTIARASKVLHPADSLYVQTGTLRRSWVVRGSAFGKGGFVVQMATSTKYAIYHDKQAGKDLAPNIPKRIDLWGQFKIQGIPQIHKAIELKLGGKTKLTGGR